MDNEPVAEHDHSAILVALARVEQKVEEAASAAKETIAHQKITNGRLSDLEREHARQAGMTEATERLQEMTLRIVAVGASVAGVVLGIVGFIAARGF